MTTTHDHEALVALATRPDTPASVLDLVQARARLTPHAPAVTQGCGALTYGELNHQAEHLAGQLKALGVGTDVLVGLCLPRSLDMVVGALGIMRAGGAYVPMDPDYPVDRLSFMLDDAATPVLITTPAIAQRLPRGDRVILHVESAGSDAFPTVGALPPVDPADLAYVIYTSGSTGTPKGVEITHRGLANLVSWHNAAFSVTPADRASHVAGLSFDAAVWELWPYLAAGASVHLVDEHTRLSAELLREWLLARRITIGFVPTPLVERLITSGDGWPEDTSLRVLLTGGDTLHHHPPPGLPFTLVNNYGPTEYTVVATSGPVWPSQAPDLAPPIGRAIANTRTYLLNERMEPVSPGEAGELCIGGASLARGYRGRPDLTSARFVPDPFALGRGDRLYKTGDLARELPDGQLAFLGRIDDQIKIRGYRVEPGEITSALNRHPEIRDSLVMAREEYPGDIRLVAYLVLAPDWTATPSQLRDFLRASLPDYMVPSSFVHVDDFPLTQNGKVDRQGLMELDPGHTLEDEVTAFPLTATEQRVAEMLGELLHLEEIDLEDNFFMLGGHSLLGAQLIARLRQAFGVELTLRSLFEAPTVAALSAEVDRLGLAVARSTRT